MEPSIFPSEVHRPAPFGFAGGVAGALFLNTYIRKIRVFMREKFYKNPFIQLLSAQKWDKHFFQTFTSIVVKFSVNSGHYKVVFIREESRIVLFSRHIKGKYACSYEKNFINTPLYSSIRPESRINIFFKHWQV